MYYKIKLEIKILFSRRAFDKYIDFIKSTGVLFKIKRFANRMYGVHSVKYMCSPNVRRAFVQNICSYCSKFEQIKKLNKARN